MKPVFVDAFFYVALLDKKDKFHHRALQFAQTYNGELVTTQWVLLEVANGLGESRIRVDVAILLRELAADPSVDIIPATNELFWRGVELYAARPDKEWSLTDCISFSIMAEKGLTEALTGDHHFAQAGFIPLLADPR